MALSGYFNTSAYNNLYIEFSWTGVQSISGNYTDVSWVATARRSSGSGGYYAHWWIYVNGSLVNSRSQSNRILITNGMQIASGTTRIYHNTDGTKSFSASIDAAIYTYATNCSGSGSWTLNTIPRYANPKISMSGRTETSLTVAWSADGTVDSLQYSTNNGSSWSTATNPNASSGSFTINGLSANTAYNVKVRARRKDSQLTNDSSAVSMTTYNYPYASGMPNFTIGNAVNLTLYNPLQRSVSVILRTNGGTQVASGTTTGTSISLTGTAATLYASIPNAKSANYSVRVTYSGHNEDRTGGLYSVNESASAPTIGAFTYADSNATVVGITGNNQKIVQNISTPRFTASGLVAKNSASLSNVKVVVNGATYSASASSTTNLQGGVINSASNVTATLTVTDSRGVTSTKTLTIQMIAWTNPSAIITAQRKSNFYSETDVKVDASYTEIGANSIQITLVGQAVPIAGQTTPSDVTATLPDNVAQVISFDNDFAWNVTFTLTDTLGGSTVYRIYLQRGIPLAYFDRHRSSVALEKFPEHDQSFEVNGDIYGHNLTADGDIDATGSLDVAGEIYTQGANATDVVLECKNVLVYPYSDNTKTTNGITFTVNDDGSVTANGTATASAYFNLSTWSVNNMPFMHEAGKSVILSGCPSGASSTTYGIVAAYRNPTEYTLARVYNEEVEFIVPNDVETYAIFIVIQSGVRASGIVFKPMVRDASITDSTFVPYAMTNRQLTETIGKTYTASFTASSASSNNQAISNSITIPVGTYLLVASLPVLSATTGAFSIETGENSVVEAKYQNGASYASLVVVATFKADVTLHMAWNASAAVNFSYLERGGLKAVRLR